jgi:hypothetical protein
VRTFLLVQALVAVPPEVVQSQAHGGIERGVDGARREQPGHQFAGAQQARRLELEREVQR